MKGRLHYWTLEVLFILLIVFISTKISFLFHPIGVFVSTLFFPILISGFLFFILDPIVDTLVKRKVPRTLAILGLYLAGAGIIFLFGATIGPPILDQVTSLAKNTPQIIDSVRNTISDLSNSSYFEWLQNQEFINIAGIEKKLIEYSTLFTSNLFNSVSGLFSFIANLTLIIAIVPFILFYMLKDGDRLPNQLVKFVPGEYRNEGHRILRETSKTLADYIQGQIIVCLFVALGNMIGYLIIGLDYALLFALIIGVLNIIPYVGPWLGATPAVFIAFLDSPTKALLVIVVVVIVQQIDGNLISPLVIGNKLEVHPLTIMVVLLVAGNLAGVLGMVLAVPTYAVSRIIFKNFLRIWRLRQT